MEVKLPAKGAAQGNGNDLLAVQPSSAEAPQALGATGAAAAPTDFACRLHQALGDEPTNTDTDAGSDGDTLPVQVMGVVVPVVATPDQVTAVVVNKVQTSVPVVGPPEANGMAAALQAVVPKEVDNDRSEAGIAAMGRIRGSDTATVSRPVSPAGTPVMTPPQPWIDRAPVMAVQSLTTDTPQPTLSIGAPDVVDPHARLSLQTGNGIPPQAPTPTAPGSMVVPTIAAEAVVAGRGDGKAGGDPLAKPDAATQRTPGRIEDWMGRATGEQTARTIAAQKFSDHARRETPVATSAMEMRIDAAGVATTLPTGDASAVIPHTDRNIVQAPVTARVHAEIAQAIAPTALDAADKSRRIVIESPDTGRIEIGLARDGRQLRVELHCSRAEMAEGLQRHHQSLSRELQQSGGFHSVDIDVRTSADDASGRGSGHRQPVPQPPDAEDLPETQALRAALTEILDQITGAYA